MLTIRTLVAMCPLIGLLGTVTGMIGVFEVMAQQGTGNPRLMAAGISQGNNSYNGRYGSSIIRCVF